MKKLIYYLFPLLVVSCGEKDASKSEPSENLQVKLFEKIESDVSQINFSNKIKESIDFNFLNYPYLYTGGGVATGDINNDGLVDVYLTANQGPNKLYLNKGNFEFEDITGPSKTEDYSGFSTGVTMLDVNNDGWLDIYVCKAGSLNNENARRNLLFVNQKNGSFTEESKKWGLDDPGFATQAYSIDYDKDGDLDIYIVNYRYDFKNNNQISGDIQSKIEEITSDQLYRNDGERFTKVTGEAGIYNKTWGLAAAVGDFNNDGWEDIYVSNDYLEPDIMYINQKDGTFKDAATSMFKHLSFNSMGSDYADLNNDLYPDLFTLDMLAENYARSKENMASMSTENFMNMVKVGYHHAYMANMLHVNTGNGVFKETGQISGVVKTDWSWAPLIADFDNDGLKDIFISNGIYKDYTNQDFRSTLREKNENGEQMTLESVINLLPSERLSNYVYQNKGHLKFEKSIDSWGLNDPSFSNGAAYADFDNDGDLDLIVNNVNDNIGLYRNNSKNNYLQIQLKGDPSNPMALGTNVYVKTGDSIQHQQLYLTRGFQSSLSNILTFGLGKTENVSEIMVQWPNGKTSSVSNPKINKRIDIAYSSATDKPLALQRTSSKYHKLDASQFALDYVQKENDFNDYDLQLLIPQKQSTKGTRIAKADVNKDGLEDIFIGNASGAHAALYIQTIDGKFKKSNQALWQSEAKYEDANAHFFDADNDGDLDLYVVSAGYELSESSNLLQDRLYFNDGKGNFAKRDNALPKMLTSGKSIATADVDNDGDLDIFVGGNVIPGKYPLAPKSYLLVNDNGKFKDATSENLSLSKIGMVSEALFTDYDSDGDPDILVVGEWMKPTFFNNTNGTFEKAENISGLDKTEGWWFAATVGDFDGDGDDDYVFGNLGDNNKFHPSEKKPLSITAKDFDENGTFDVAMSKISDGRIVPVRGKECSSQQNPFLLDKIGTYKEFANMDFNEIYGEEKLKDAFSATVYNFKSMYAENLGNGKFKITELPTEAQLGPTLSFVTQDVNGDGNLDVLGVGAIYDAEVETIRYDSNMGYVLLGDGKGSFAYSKEYEPLVNSDAKDIKSITIKDKNYFIVASTNAPLTVFSF